MAHDIGNKPDPIPGGKPLYPNDYNIPDIPGKLHDTVVVDPNGGISNPHITWNPDGGSREDRVHIWPNPKNP